MGQLFSIFLNVVTPVFGLALIGYLAGPRLGLEARTLSRTAYFIFVPAFVFNIFSQAQVEIDLAARMMAYIFVVDVACGILGFIVARLLGHSAEMIAAYILIAVFSNVGNFGLSIISFRFGETALTAGTVYFLTINITAFTIGVAAASWARGGKLSAVLAVFKTPGVVAAFPAAFFWLTPWEVPMFLARMGELLGGAMIPVLLVTMGVQLAEIGRPHLNRDVILASGVRLLGGPVLAVLLVFPFGLTGLERGAGILQASMPPAVLTIIVAMEHELAPKFVTTTLLAATLASLVTLTVLLSLL
jgi:hypothetical protein